MVWIYPKAHGTVWQRLRGSWELWFFRWVSDEWGVEALVGSGGLRLALHYSTGTLIARKPGAFRPARHRLPNLAILVYVAAETDRRFELRPGGRRLPPSPILEHPLLGLLIHTRSKAFLLSAWFIYCLWLLFKSPGSGNLVLQPALVLPQSHCSQLLLFMEEQCVYIHGRVLTSWRDFWHLENRAFKNISYLNTFHFIKPGLFIPNQVKWKEVGSSKVLKKV